MYGCSRAQEDRVRQCAFALPNRGGGWGGGRFCTASPVLVWCQYDHVVVVGFLLVADPRASTLLAPRSRPQLQSWLGPALGQLCRQVSCRVACSGGVAPSAKGQVLGCRRSRTLPQAHRCITRHYAARSLVLFGALTPAMLPMGAVRSQRCMYPPTPQSSVLGRTHACALKPQANPFVSCYSSCFRTHSEHCCCRRWHCCCHHHQPAERHS